MPYSIYKLKDSCSQVARLVILLTFLILLIVAINIYNKINWFVCLSFAPIGPLIMSLYVMSLQITTTRPMQLMTISIGTKALFKYYVYISYLSACFNTTSQLHYNNCTLRIYCTSVAKTMATTHVRAHPCRWR